jgi:hypothetical protein
MGGAVGFPKKKLMEVSLSLSLSLSLYRDSLRGNV